MKEITKSGSSFVGYEYKEVMSDQEKTSMYVDSYLNFGWVLEEKFQPASPMSKVKIKFKRDRKILNKTELTRLQRHFEACMSEIETMEKSKNSLATVWALTIAIIGTAFMSGSVFAVTSDPPMIILCIILAIPAFIGWLLPPFVYKATVQKSTEKIEPLIEQKYDEVYGICEKGNKLLTY